MARRGECLHGIYGLLVWHVWHQSTAGDADWVRCRLDVTSVHVSIIYGPCLQVFARLAPEQKELVVRTLRAAGWTTLMCGASTNDVGALKALMWV